jgi:hypothetical protein
VTQASKSCMYLENIYESSSLMETT